MVLYYLKHSMPNREVPDELIDTNVRIDYGKLRHLLVTGRQLNGNFDLLRDVIGEEQVDTRIRPGFPLQDLTDPGLGAGALRRRAALTMVHTYMTVHL